MDALKKLTEGQLKTEAPEVVVGNTVKVHVNIKRETERIQIFEGTVIAKNGSELPRPSPSAVFPTA